MKQEIYRKVSIILFSTGMLVGFILAVGTNWVHFEMPFYFDYSYAAVRTTDQAYSKLICPIILTKADRGLVSVDITNNADKAIKILFRGEISFLGGITRNVEYTPTIPIGETSRIQFEVNQDDVVFNNMILVRTYQFSTYKTPSRMGSCAILMIPISLLTGTDLLVLIILISGSLIISGKLLWIRSNRPMRGQPRNMLAAMTTMSLFLLAAIVAGIEGWWIPGVLMLVVIVLLTVVSGYFETSPTNDRI